VGKVLGLGRKGNRRAVGVFDLWGLLAFGDRIRLEGPPLRIFRYRRVSLCDIHISRRQLSPAGAAFLRLR